MSHFTGLKYNYSLKSFFQLISWTTNVHISKKSKTSLLRPLSCCPSLVIQEHWESKVQCWLQTSSSQGRGTSQQSTNMPIISTAMALVTIKWYQHWKLISVAHVALSQKCFGFFRFGFPILQIVHSCIQPNYPPRILGVTVRGTIPAGNHLPTGHISPCVEPRL